MNLGSISVRGTGLSVLHSAQTDSGAHPASCTVVIGDRDVKVNTHFRHVPECVMLNVHSPIRLHGVVMN
jgi:hypothetical protein